MLRVTTGWMLFLITPMFGGCVIYPVGGGGGGGGGGGSGDTAADGKQARTEETDTFLAQVVYKGAKVMQSVQTQDGAVVDGLDRSTLPALPYGLPALPFTPADVMLPPGVTSGTTDVDQIPKLADLVSKTAAYNRPNFSPYILGETDATSVTDYLDRYEVGGAPQGNRLYAGLVSNQANRGISGYMNQFQPEVADGTFSLIEFAVGCPAGNPTEAVGVAISVDKVTVGGRNEQGVYDGLPRLRVEYAISKNGKVKYTWDELDGKFVANPLRRVRPGEIVPVSVPGGAQVEHLLTIFQSPTGDWWIAYDLELLGYYPASLFTMLNKGACEARWYGEVYNPHPENGAVKSELGSGKFPAAGRPNVAYIRLPKYYDTSWFSVEPPDLFFSRPVVESCYARSVVAPDPVSGDHIFTLGGPGGKDPGCKWPFP